MASAGLKGELSQPAGGLLSRSRMSRDGRDRFVHSRHATFCIHLSVDDDASELLLVKKRNRQRMAGDTRLTSVQVSDVRPPAVGHLEKKRREKKRRENVNKRYSFGDLRRSRRCVGNTPSVQIH